MNTLENTKTSIHEEVTRRFGGRMIALSVLFATSLPATAEPPQLKLPERVELLREVDVPGPAEQADRILESFRVSPDRGKYWYFHKSSAGDVLTLDGRSTTIRHAMIAPGSVRVSSDGRSHFCIAKVGAESQAVVDGRVAGFKGENVRFVGFLSGDKPEPVYVVKSRQGDSQIVAGEYVSDPHRWDESQNIPAVVSPCGSRFAYMDSGGERRRGAYYGRGRLFVDGKKITELFGATDFQFSDDGSSFLCSVMPERRSPMAVCFNGKLYSEIWARNELVIGPRGRRWAAIDQDGLLVVDGKKMVGFKGCRDLTFSPDGEHLAFIWNDDENRCLQLIQDETAVATADRFMSTPIYSGDGSQLAIVAFNLDTRLCNVVVNGKTGPTYDKILCAEGLEEVAYRYPGFDTDSRRFLYWARNRQTGNKWMLVDRNEELVEVGSGMPNAVSTDGKRLVISGEEENIKSVSTGGTEEVTILPGQDKDKSALEHCLLSDGAICSVTVERSGKQIRMDDGWLKVRGGGRLLQVGDFSLDLASIAPDGLHLNICEDSENGWFWEAEDGSLLVTLVGQSIDPAIAPVAYWLRINR